MDNAGVLCFIKVCVCVRACILLSAAHLSQISLRKAVLALSLLRMCCENERSGIQMISYHRNPSLPPLTAFQLLSNASQLIQRWSLHRSCSIICSRISRFFFFFLFPLHKALCLGRQLMTRHELAMGCSLNTFDNSGLLLNVLTRFPLKTISHISF